VKAIGYINAHKILVIPVVLVLTWAYDNWSTAAFIYLGMHGTYSLLRPMKEGARSIVRPSRAVRSAEQ
jgi:hypothetical protein